MLAVIFALGSLMAPQELADAVATSGEASAVIRPAGPSVTDAGQASLLRSVQTLSGQVSGTTVTAMGGQSGIRSGDISLEADSVGSGLQALNLSTGLASLGQASISIATGSLALGAAAE